MSVFKKISVISSFLNILDKRAPRLPIVIGQTPEKPNVECRHLNYRY